MAQTVLSTAALPSAFHAIRDQTLDLCSSLELEDFVVQSMPEVSPTKWHLAHTTWFFEQFVLVPFVRDYRVFDGQYHYLFNSYYQTAGRMHPRPQRGLLSRPLVKEIMQYRECVDEAIARLLESSALEEDIRQRLILGINHEQQHQELLLTDIKHVFSVHPQKPAVNGDLSTPPKHPVPDLTFLEHPGGLAEIGADTSEFHFDNETPKHQLLVPAHALGSRLVTNREFADFIADGGYETSDLWLSDGWGIIQERAWNRPLYWSQDLQSEFTLGGERSLNPNAPVCHVSYYEADAYARWAGCRLPTETEWELAAAPAAVTGNLLESGYWHPASADGHSHQYFGDTWEWTSSPYAPYPGFKPLAGSLGEYNGKFMCNQITVRGGSCVTASDHIRASYRSFFYPDARWQVLGFRLARDGGGDSCPAT
ncbi:MAG: ergothioneine biosynthesis protein EgtB [Xanthomonadales bacterium]|jgi:ergothioneine biosynthesis protein EgtB|nr:ergothioneine biosynthesis protein EgtB [Xanthomonadales bacterium]MDH4000108.1 ergothioneine biosynthesis protein EgtB [Xanthomonadales bacterium]